MNKSFFFILTNYFLKISNINTPYITKTAGEFMFDGYDDPLIDIIVELKKYFPIDLPFQKVGWLYGVITFFSIIN